MTYEHIVNGRVYVRRAWTGGDWPPVSSNDHQWNMVNELTGPFNAIRCQLYREQLGGGGGHNEP